MSSNDKCIRESVRFVRRLKRRGFTEDEIHCVIDKLVITNTERENGRTLASYSIKDLYIVENLALGGVQSQQQTE